MSEIIDTTDNGLVEDDNNIGNASEGDASEQRLQHQPQGTYHGRQILQPPRGFRIRHIQPNRVGEMRPDGNIASVDGASNGNGPQHSSSNGNGDGNSNATRNANIQRIRANLNGNAPEHSPLNGNANGNANGDRSNDTDVRGIDLNSNVPQRFSLNRNANGNHNANRNVNVQRLRLNMGGRGPFMVRQQQQGSNRFTQIAQSQLQQEQGSPQQPPQQPLRQTLIHSFGPSGAGPVHVQVQVDPLAPQPLPASMAFNSSLQSISNTHRNPGRSKLKTEDPADYERYKCEICYEYSNDPVGCGKCASRFCRACLQRVYDSDKQKQKPTRCPVCRCEYDEMVPDHDMYGASKGEKAPTLPCRYVCIGCTERNLPLSEIAKHEKVCDHVPVRCRYAKYGCQWIGKRGLVGAHEEYGCKLAPMGKFVEEYRQTKANHTMRMEMIAQQAAGSLRMSHVLRQTYTRDNQRKSLSDTLRLFQYCHAVTGLTPHFLMTKDLWVSYWRNNESRAAVVNFCTCIPFLSAALGVIWRSTNSFFELFEETSPDKTLAILARVLDGVNLNATNKTNHTSTEKISKIMQRIQISETDELLLTTFLGVCVGALGILVVVLTYIDTKSNISWDKISLPYIGGRFPFVGDVMAISIFTLLLAIMEYHDSNMRAVVLWITIVVTSTFFPALIFSISHYTARLVTRTERPPVFNMMEMARLVEPCMFGLRFSMMISSFGVVPTLDATVLLSLVPQTSRLHLKNTQFDHLSRTARFAFLSVKSAIWAFRVQNLIFNGDMDTSILKSAMTFESAQQFFESSPDAVALSVVFDTVSSSILATAGLMVTNCIINNSFALGNTLGDYIAMTSHGELSPGGIARGTAKEYSSMGLITFGSWAMMVAFLARI